MTNILIRCNDWADRMFYLRILTEVNPIQGWSKTDDLHEDGTEKIRIPVKKFFRSFSWFNFSQKKSNARRIFATIFPVFRKVFEFRFLKKGKNILRIRNQWVIIHVAKMNHCTELVSCLHFKLFNATRGSQSVLIKRKINSKCPVCLSEPKSCDSHSFNPYKKSFLITESKQS